MLLALLLNPVPRAVVWIFMLSWMGGACLANVRRCGRTHCRYTGPFFVGMAAAVLAYISGVLPLGSQPWLFLGLVIALELAFRSPRTGEGGLAAPSTRHANATP